MVETKETKKSKPAIIGGLFAPTQEGFKRLLEDANKQQRRGYEVVSIVRLEKKIAVVYRRAVFDGESKPYDNFVGDEDITGDNDDTVFLG